MEVAALAAFRSLANLILRRYAKRTMNKFSILSFHQQRDLLIHRDQLTFPLSS